MGGVGKTTILQHIHNELLERPDICDHVWWVTVSQDFSINRLQNLIAKRLYLDLSSEDDDLCRAAKFFELHDVGIQSSLKGCKLILTTRSQTENLGHHIALSDEVEGIAKAVVRECAGLPLGIITVAGSLRGVDDLYEWRNTLKK
uniref:NB-ARC domain-containing protein n=1 Tax=Salix viminalis TaxID=40686 RepID=A0A6N2KTH2_SALVM